VATLALDPQTGGFLITNGRTTLLRGAAAGAVKIANQFKLFKGSWFRDTRVGIPYFPAIFGVKNPDLNVARQFFRGVLLGTLGVKNADVTVSFNAAAREMDVAFKAQWDDGATITATSLDQPFLVDVPVGAVA